MSKVIRIYQDDTDWEPVWVVSGPGRTCTGGGSTAEAVLERYYAAARRSKTDLTDVVVEYGHYERVWVKH